MKIKLNYVGKGRNSDIPIYKDQKGKFWGDLNYKDESKPEYREFTEYMDDYDDWQDGIASNKLISEQYPNADIIKESDYERDPDLAFNYALLDRYRSDAEYFLGYGNCNLNRLKDGSINKHIDYMKQLFNSFPEEKKPEWISMEDIDNYKKEMLEEINDKQYKQNIGISRTELIVKLPGEKQEKIRAALINAGIKGDDLERGMNSKICELEDTIDVKSVLLGKTDQSLGRYEPNPDVSKKQTVNVPGKQTEVEM